MTTLDPPAVWAVPEPPRPIHAPAREAPPGRALFVSGQSGLGPDGRMRVGFAAQLAQAMDNVEALLASAGMSRADVAKATFILTRAEDLPALARVRRARWASDAPAAATVFVALALARADALVEVEVTAVRRPAPPGLPVLGGLSGALGRAAGRLLGRPRRADRLDAHGDWLLRDLGLDRAAVESVDERRRRTPPW